MMMEYSNRASLPSSLPMALRKQFNVMLFQPLIKELRRHLNGQNSAFELYRFDRNEPRLKSLSTDIVFDKREAIRPDAFVIQVHASSGYRCKTFCQKSDFKATPKGQQIFPEGSTKKRASPLDFLEYSFRNQRNNMGLKFPPLITTNQKVKKLHSSNIYHSTNCSLPPKGSSDFFSKPPRNSAYSTIQP